MPVVDPKKSAQQAGLRYVSDTTPGIERRPWGRGFTYLNAEGEHIQSDSVRDRIEALAIPPSWQEVWICSDPKGHLQATGRDAKGRKQYRYHPQWRQVRNQAKFERMLPFGLGLSDLRSQVDQHIRQRQLSREKVLATVVKLLETTLIRVGNAEYAQENQSFGLTTLRDRHVKISGQRLQFQFRGKSGVEHEIALSDRRLAKIVKRCRDIPGYELFQYFDQAGDRQTIDSGDVNEYLQQVTGQDFTAKEFRTWAGTVLAAQELVKLGRFESDKQAQHNVVQAVKAVAKQLGNRAATCRKYYVHPGILTAYSEDWLIPVVQEALAAKVAKTSDHLRPPEQAVLKILNKLDKS
ncbi:DNA topoisomerase IB [Almyronema epifaneia]|uniref:DNA topoisomerase n=1 Tax=Almyronema epifaneia S1 TaxID=2991925 RepID=A0ABW6IEE8_9CYAN